jgi:hypothetical protein
MLLFFKFVQRTSGYTSKLSEILMGEEVVLPRVWKSIAEVD